MNTFIAIDGEGLTRGNETCSLCAGSKSEHTHSEDCVRHCPIEEHTHINRHDYVLLAASDGSFIEDWGQNGLGTEQCFEYLLSLGQRHKGRILCGFYTSYDVNMLFRDLGADILSGLWLGGMWSWRAKSGDYQQYRIEYVPNRVLKIQQGCWTIFQGSAKPKWKAFRSVTWWDCSQFFQSSFVKALVDWEAADKETLDRIASMKDARGAFTAEEQTRIREYCLDECRLLVGMMDRLSATLDGLDLKLTSWYGAGSIATAVFKREGIKQHIKRDWDEAVNKVIMRSYYGGRVETFAVGIRETESYNWDVRSAYPSAMRFLPSLRDCSVVHADAYDYGVPYAIWHVTWKARKLPQRLTPFPFRFKKRIFWPHSGEGWYHAEEVRAAFDVFGDGKRGIDLTVHEGYVFNPATDELPFGWVSPMYEERARLKREGDPREKPLKLALNSGYGKCAQSIGGRNGEPPPFQCYMWAGMITAHCRAALLRAASKSNDILAIATDGLFVGDKLDLPEGEHLGDWECQKVEPGLMLIQPGVYATPSLGKTKGSFAKSRGFSAKGIDYQALMQQWSEKRMSGSIKIPETRFIGLGYALATNTLQTHWRRWVRGVKTIHFSGTTSKSFDPTQRMDSDLVRLVAPAPPAEISDAYVPRKRGSKDEQKEAELQAELLASQPDLEDNIFTWN